MAAESGLMVGRVRRVVVRLTTAAAAAAASWWLGLWLSLKDLAKCHLGWSLELGEGLINGSDFLRPRRPRNHLKAFPIWGL